MCNLEYRDPPCLRLSRAQHREPPRPVIAMPAMPPLALIERVAQQIERWQCRRQLKRLLKMDARLLADIGHDRLAIDRALRASPGRNPCMTLACGGRLTACQRGANRW